MKKDILFEYAVKANIATGNISAYYDLSGSVDTQDPNDRDINYKAVSGATTNVFDNYVIYNKLHGTGNQVVYTGDQNESIVSEDFNPAVITSSSTKVTGSGFFDSRSTLKSVSSLTGDSWTCFLDFSGDLSFRKPELNQIILSTMPEANSESGLHVGINGSNRLYYEYVSGKDDSNNWERETETLPNHLKKQNVVSVSKNSELLEVSLHTPDQGSFSIKTSPDNFTKSQDLYFGGFKDGDSYNHFFTGFSGSINTIVLFNDYVTETNRNTFSEAYFLDTFTPPGFTTGERTTKQVTGSEIQSLASGYGITGYEYKKSGDFSNEAGDVIPFYAKSGVEGVVYQNILVDLTGDADIKSITGFYAGESSERNAGYVDTCNSVPGKIIFNKLLTTDDHLEIYNHKRFLETVSLTSDSLYSLATINVDNAPFEIRGVELESNKFSYVDGTKQPNIQFFIDGVCKQEVSGLYSVSDIYNNKNFSDYKGDYFINDNEAGSSGSGGAGDRIKNNKYQIFLNSHNDYINITEDDVILFDVVSGNSITGYYDGTDAHYTGEYLNKDIYINGQKLTSGTDYSQSTYNGKTSYLLDSSAINPSIPDGDLFFVPQATTDFDITTYDGGGKEFSVSNIFFEQVWVNGIRQAPGVDYYKSPTNTLITSATPSLENNSFDFKVTNDTIDVSVNDTIKSSSDGKVRQKVFSFDSEGKENLFIDES